MAMDDGKRAELKQLCEEAVSEYSSKSKTGSITEKWKTLVNKDADLDKVIEQQESGFSRFRNTHGKFWGVCKTTITQLRKLGEVAQAGIGLTPFAPASIIVKAALFLIDSGSAVADTYDSLEELFKKIRDISNRLDEYSEGTIDHKLRKIVTTLLCAVLNVFCEAEAAIRRGRGREMMRRVAGKENKIQTALDQLDETVRSEISLITAKTYTTTQRMDEKAEADRSRNLLRQALYTGAAEDNDVFHAGIESSRMKQSGDWLRKEKLFDKWVQMGFPVLWILGKPGTGKTYLASRVIQNLQQSPSPGTVGYFYIREGMNTQHTPEVVLKTIAYQITGLHDAYRELAIAACKDGNSLLSPNSIWDSLFVKPFKADTVASKPLFVIIDGVDEATPGNQELLVKMAKSLSDLRSKRGKLPAIQLLLLGRPDLDYNVSNAWWGERERPKIIHVQPSSSKADIERFIKKGVDGGIPLLKKMGQGHSKRLRREIITTLSDSSDGMFMLAKLMLAEIKDMNKPELIREALAKSPLGLDDMFKRVITRLTVVGGFDKKDLNELIMWVACAKRDLLLGELDLALKLRDLGQDGIVGLDDELRTRFGSFFNVANPEPDADDEEDDISVTGIDVSGRAEADTDSDHWIDVDSEEKEDGDEAGDEDEDGDDVSDIVDDDEEEDDIPYRFFVATVKFGHASVGQYFRTAPFHEGIGLEINLAQGHIAMTCLRFLTGNIPKRNQRPWRQPDLFKYSADHFLDHLTEVQPEALKALHPTEFSKLSDEILVLFRDSASLRRWFQSVSDEHKFMCQLFSQSTYSRIREYIPEPPDEVHPDSEAQWLRRAKASSEFLLEPFAKSIAEGWLVFDSCDGILAILFLHGYMSTRGDSPGKWTLPPNRPFEQIAESISPEEIRQMISLGGLKMENTEDWHLDLGYTLRRINTRRHLLAAVEEFQYIIQKSSDADKRHIGCLEEAHGLFSLEEYREAIAAASRALESLPAYRSPSKLELLQLIQDANLHLGNHEAALKASSDAWESAPYSPDVAFNLIYTHHKTGRFIATVPIIRSILTPEESRLGAGFLGEIMRQQRYASEFISIACAEAGELDLARDAFIAVASQATKSGDSSGRALAYSALAKLYFQFYQDDDKAIEMWESIVKDDPGTVAAVDASFALAPLYFTNAADPGKADADDSWVSKLKQLLSQWELQTSHGAEMRIPVEEISALLGRWYAQRGEVDLAKAKILPLTTLGIRDLTDRDNSNDFRAYGRLARALICFGDRENAEIAYALTKPLRKSKELLDFETSVMMSSVRPAEPEPEPPSKEERNIEPTERFNFIGSCDGRCNRRKVDFRSFSMCEVCIDIAFCDECLQKLIDGNLSFRVCNPKHPHLEIYPPKGLVTKGVEGYMVRIRDERVVSVDDWLDMISRDWLDA
ncbi:hypothetical protein QBC43DRAFT_330021 [Cladorrhinum sp. PSN259]|nr:hypothetical protein QBC43DRAFT_330021 [Cladorrhinum sp. PSN259]